jgi:hypothetical protein
MTAPGGYRRTWLCLACFVLSGCGGAKKPAAVSGNDAGREDASIGPGSPADGGTEGLPDAGSGPHGGAQGGASDCQPTGCEALGARCGNPSDGCDGSLDCGICGEGARCEDNECRSCTAKSCSELAWSCGSGSDACSGTLDCGACADGETCYEHACCTPRTCSSADCADVPDGCGGTLSCPCEAVIAGKVCGRVSAMACIGPGAATKPACSCQLPAVCDPRNGGCCVPLACADLCKAGAYDGSDGCGTSIHCDACPATK